MKDGVPKILVVDDDINLVALCSEILEGEGYEVDAVYNGTAALNWAWTNDIDMILLDIMLPDIDGISVCRQLKSDPRLRSVPVVLISASDSLREKGKSYADGTLAKPFEIDRLLHVVQGFLQVA